MVKRVLQVVGIMNMGGIENLIMNVYRNINREEVQFDFLVTREEKGFFDDEIISLGGKVYNIPSMSVVGYLKHKKLVNEFLKKHVEYDVIHCHRDALCSIYLKEAKNLGIKIRIAHCHSTMIGKEKNIKSILNLCVKKYFKIFSNKYATHYFACGREAGQWLFGKKITNQNLQIISNGIKLKDYTYSREISCKVRKQLGVNQECVVFGHIGSFRYVKNHDLIIDLFHKANICNSKLILIGEGELKGKIKKKVKDLGLEDKVLFLGLRTDVNKLLMSIDIFLFPSIFEGLPIALVEAQASGAICLISDSITEEVDFGIDLIKRLNINDNAKWIKEIKFTVYNLNKIRENRVSKLEDIKKRGYDIISTSDYLFRLYNE